MNSAGGGNRFKAYVSTENRNTAPISGTMGANGGKSWNRRTTTAKSERKVKMEINEEAMREQIKQAADKLRSRMKMTITTVDGGKVSHIESNVPPLVYVPVLMSIVTQELVKMINSGKADADDVKRLITEMWEQTEKRVE